jgi:hypothetical protein
MDTLNYETYLRGTGMQFSVGMYSSWQLAVVRSGDVPIYIDSFNPLTPLPSFDPAVPFYFLVRKNATSPWRYLYFVPRFFDKHASVTPSPFAPAVDEDPDLFALRRRVFSVYTSKGNCSIPAELSVDAGHKGAYSVQDMLQGAGPCDVDCGKDSNYGILSCDCTTYGFQDSDYICKAWTRDSGTAAAPADDVKMFAIIPEAFSVAVHRMTNCSADSIYPRQQGFIITDTLDLNYISYVRFRCTFYINFNPSDPLQNAGTMLLLPKLEPRKIIDDTRGLATDNLVGCTVAPRYLGTLDYGSYMMGKGMTFAVGMFSAWQLSVWRGGAIIVVLPGYTFNPLTQLPPFDQKHPFYFAVRENALQPWQFLYFVKRVFDKRASVQDNTLYGVPLSSTDTPADTALDKQRAGITVTPTIKGDPLTVANLGPLFQFRRQNIVGFINGRNWFLPAEVSIDAKSDGNPSIADFLWGAECTPCPAATDCYCTTYSLRDNDFSCKVATVGLPVGSPGAPEGRPPKVFAVVNEALDLTQIVLPGSPGNRFPTSQGFLFTDTMDEAVIWYTRRNCKMYVTFDVTGGALKLPDARTIMLQPAWNPRTTLEDGLQGGDTSYLCGTYTPALRF